MLGVKISVVQARKIIILNNENFLVYSIKVGFCVVLSNKTPLTAACHTIYKNMHTHAYTRTDTKSDADPSCFFITLEIATLDNNCGIYHICLIGSCGY